MCNIFLAKTSTLSSFFTRSENYGTSLSLSGHLVLHTCVHIEEEDRGSCSNNSEEYFTFCT